MTVVNDGGPAFPCIEDYTISGAREKHIGISTRDYFAGQALAGMNWMSYEQIYINDAEMCYLIADAMLKARDAK